MSDIFELFNITNNAWLSTILSAPVYDIAIYEGKIDTIDNIDKVIKELDEYLRSKKTRLVSIRTNTHSVGLIRQLESRGFFYIETILRLMVQIRNNELLRKYALFPVRLAVESDVEGITKIACETFAENRLMKDKNFPPEIIRKYYSNWIKNSFADKNDDIYVLEAGGEVKGFYIVRKINENKVNLLLVGVKNDAKNSFYGVPLYVGVHIKLAEQKFKIGESEILATNLPVLNIYTLLGAKYHSSEIRLHKWFK